MKKKLAERLEILILVIIVLLVLFIAFKVQAHDRHLRDLTTKFNGIEFVYEESQ